PGEARDGRLHLAQPLALAPVERRERIGELLQPLMRHVMRGKAAIERIGRTDTRPGQRQIAADAAGTEIEEPTRADIGEKADMDLGHGKDGALGGDAVRAVDRDAAAAAHGDPVDQRDIGLGEAMNALDQAIFLAEEIRLVVAGTLLAPCVIDRAHIAAGAESAVAGAAHQQRLDLRLGTPGDELRVEDAIHLQGKRVERLRAVQRDDAEPASVIEQDLVGDLVHGPRLVWASSRRAMMTRMISLVPSRIWCTRTSRR